MLSPEQSELLQSKAGLVATVVISGSVDDMYATAHEEMRCFNIKNGFENVEYRRESAILVEPGRDRVVEHALNQNYDWVLQIDADMVFPADAMLRLLTHHYINIPNADAIGAYCTLKGHPFLPTIDTGTGTWESHYPGSGIMQVIRTGTAFMMAKTSAFRKFGPPWFRTKHSNKVLEAMQGVDNAANCWLDGRNPLRDTAAWKSLYHEAMKRGGTGEGAIGEDSGFCDRLKMAGGTIFVDTDIAVGHVGKKVYGWTDHKDAMKDRKRMQRLIIGVRG
jgi:hypothetical protein